MPRTRCNGRSRWRNKPNGYNATTECSKKRELCFNFAISFANIHRF